MKAEIFSIGTELLMGELTDTNGSWIAAQLPALGIQVQWLSIICDDLSMLAEAFERGVHRSDFIFTTGGLGPTQDDLTREAVARAAPHGSCCALQWPRCSTPPTRMWTSRGRNRR